MSFFESMESMVTTWIDVPSGTITFFGFGGGGGCTAATGGALVTGGLGAAAEFVTGGAGVVAADGATEEGTAGGAAEFLAGATGTAGTAPALASGFNCIESFTFVTPGEV